jgi:hypothetical protein
LENINIDMKKYLGLGAALVLTCLTLGPFVQLRAQTSQDAKPAHVITKDEAAKKYPLPPGKSYPMGSDLAVLSGGASGGSALGFIKSPYSSRVYDCRRPPASPGALLLDDSANKVFVRP